LKTDVPVPDEAISPCIAYSTVIEYDSGLQVS